MASINEVIRNRAILHQLLLQRYGKDQIMKIMKLLKTVEKDLKALLIDYKEGATKAWLKAYLKNIQKITKDYTEVLKKALTGGMGSIAQYEVNWQKKILSQLIPVENLFTMPSNEQVMIAITERPFQGAFIGDYLKRFEEATYNRIADTIRAGWIGGKTQQEIVQKILGTAAYDYKDGVLYTSRNGATSLVRTALNHASTMAKEMIYKENEDVISGVQWVATLDERTTLECAELDGQVFPIDEGPRPPAHWGCRSTTIPVTKSWREMGIDEDELAPGTRASMDGQVSETITYPEWLKTQSEEFQQEVLDRMGANYSYTKDGTLTLEQVSEKD